MTEEFTTDVPPLLGLEVQYLNKIYCYVLDSRVGNQFNLSITEQSHTSYCKTGRDIGTGVALGITYDGDTKDVKRMFGPDFQKYVVIRECKVKPKLFCKIGLDKNNNIVITEKSEYDKTTKLRNPVGEPVTDLKEIANAIKNIKMTYVADKEYEWSKELINP
jgi:hypothetical protein